ncbi:endonuclease/exonuclease/phosphatase family protein [uncultured Pseudokineococcus sp.]|uniref:endonuclease/exonuclease/phosphatase family protein n=1 Tax=uncultured Pseudokineococcus sp. TaxID=1642928 RepID=UPI00261DDC39|nr:endonuclease/exonuclease/phosphatase family protein [uncultured Pseudokineococcus sp.]
MRTPSSRRGSAAGRRRPRADRVLDALGAGVAVVVGATALVSLAPAAVGLSMRTPWAQLVTLRAVTAAGSLALALVLLLVGTLVRLRRGRRGRPRRGPRGGWPPWVLGLTACLLVVAAGHAGVLLWRAPPPAAEAPPAAGAPGRQPGDLVVTTLNVGPQGADAEDVVALALRREADVLALSEAPEALARGVAEGLARAGRPVQLLSAPTTERGVSGDPAEALLRPRAGGVLLPYVRPQTHLLVAEGLGAYDAAPAPDLRGGAVVALPRDGEGPPLAAVHTLPAVPLLFDMDLWREETAAAVDLCGRLPGGVVAGDLNATPDHAVLAGGACARAGSAAAAPPGTWPAGLPAALAAPIDHVLLDAAAWEPVGVVVDPAGASDHRALTAVLRPR